MTIGPESSRGRESAALVSVVIPNHNYGRFVGAAVDSVLAQTYPSVEVVVIDNGSTDDSLDVLAGYADRCTILSQAEPSQAVARNRGILHSRGEYVAFLDADDVWLPTKLERQMAILAARDTVTLVYCGLWLTDERLNRTGEARAAFRGQVLDALTRYPGRAIIEGGESTAVVPRSALVKAGVFDPELSISAGWDLWRRIACYGDVDYVDEPLVLYRDHGDNNHLAPGFLGRYRTDMRYAAHKFFSDPAARSVASRRRSFLSRLDLMFAKSYFRSGDLGRAAFMLTRSVSTWPPVLVSLPGAVGRARHRPAGASST